MFGSLAKVPGAVWAYLFLAEVAYYMTIYHRTRYESLGLVSVERFRGTGFCRFTLEPRLRRLAAHASRLAPQRR